MVGDPLEVVNFQVVGIRRMPKLTLWELPEASPDEGGAVLAEREVYMNGDYKRLKIYDRTKMGRGSSVEGPAILEDPTATIIVIGGQTASVDRYGNISIRRVG